MAITFHQYRPEPLFGEDYVKVREFFLRLDNHNFPFGRWDWMVTHPCLDDTVLDRIGLWEEDGRVVAVATYESELGRAYLLMDAAYRHLGEELLAHARRALSRDDRVAVLILDGDTQMQDIAAKHGFFATQEKEHDSVFSIDQTSLHYTLPQGFHITSMAETYDPCRYDEGLWKGFNHELNGEGAYDPDKRDLPLIDRSFRRPNVNLDIKIAVVSPAGEFAAYCGMWHDPATQNALVEPVATIPEYRRMGLGRAAVLEGIRRCGLLGAKRAFVGSSQQFYYSIGFRPYATSTWWEQVKK